MVDCWKWNGGVSVAVQPSAPQGWWLDEGRRPQISVVFWDVWVVMALVGGLDW